MGGGNADTLHAASSTRRGRSGEERGAEGRLIFFFFEGKRKAELGGGGERGKQVEVDYALLRFGEEKIRI